tara:strand:- start:222 stop:494 length:273 start_codon:yes stop_codon:yes gene_type:complete
MQQAYYVITPVVFEKKKRVLGDVLILNVAQARPLQHGGFITFDSLAAKRIVDLTTDNALLREQLDVYEKGQRAESITLKNSSKPKEGSDE